MAGHADDAGRVLDEATRNQVTIPASFYREVSKILVPGTTLLVTQAPLAEAAAGTRLTVLAGTR